MTYEEADQEIREHIERKNQMARNIVDFLKEKEQIGRAHV